MRLLVNFVYCRPVGHAVEAVHHALGYRAANPDAHIAVALIHTTAIELAQLAPFVDEVFPVPLDVFDTDPDAGRAALAAVPGEWDRVVDDIRGHQEWQHAVFPGLASYYAATTERFGPIGREPLARHGIAGFGAFPYSPGEPLRIPLPAEATAAARELLGRPGPGTDGGPVVALLPGGSGTPEHYPTAASWLTVMRAIAAELPGVRFVIVGKTVADGRSSTGFTGFDALLAADAAPVASAVDVPLTRQLAVVAEADVLVSPHSGFGMAALAVGTPWLTIAGNRWPEYYFNTGVPFHSVLPDLDRFPAYDVFGPGPDMVYDEGPRSPSMSAARIGSDLAEIARETARLARGEIDFESAMKDHAARAAHIAPELGGVSFDDQLRRWG